MTPKIGVHKRNRGLLALFLAAAILFGRILISRFEYWCDTATIDDLHDALGSALWLVVAGVIIEEWDLFKKTFKFLKYTWNGRFREALCKAWADRGKIAEGLGFAILVIGLGSEMLIDPAIDGAQKAIENKTNFELEAQKIVTINALKDAKAASLDAIAALGRAKNLEEETYRLKQDNALLQNQTAELNKEAASARERAAKIEESVSWRSLTEEQKNILKEFGRNHPNIKVEFNTVKQDAEALSFCAEIRDAINSGAKIVRNCNTPFDMAVGIQMPPFAGDERNLLKAALIAAGLDPVDVSTGVFGGELFEVIIGSKPPPQWAVEK